MIPMIIFGKPKMFKSIAVLIFLLIAKNSFAQQNDVWCDITKEEMRVVQQQKSAGFELKDTLAYSPTSQSSKFKLFKIKVARIIYSTADSGRAYLNSRQYISDCMSASD